MLATMAERIRIIIDADEEVRLAVKLAATKRDISISELVCGLVRDHLADEIKDARKYVPRKKKGDAKPGTD
jgi:hypothetical protein